MNKNMFKNIVLILLLVLSAFSMVKYVSEMKERYRLQDSLTQAQDQITVLAQEKQNLLQEKQSLLQELEKEQALKEQLAKKNNGLKDYLRASKNRIARLFQSKDKVQNDLEDINIKLSILKAENRALIDSRRRIYLENEELKLKFNSVDELKKAIKDLKNKKQEFVVAEAEGNRGFVIKDGRLISPEKIKIEVVPARTKE